MSKAKKRIYEPMEKVIVAKDDLARIGYVVANRSGNTGHYGNGTWQVRIAYHLDDAQEGRHKLINYDHVQPYSEEIWQAFLRLEKKKEELVTLMHKLKMGKIPDELQPMVQADLFGIENTRPIGRE